MGKKKAKPSDDDYFSGLGAPTAEPEPVGGQPAATASEVASLEELSELLGRLSLALAQRSVGGVPAAHDLAAQLRQYARPSSVGRN